MRRKALSFLLILIMMMNILILSNTISSFASSVIYSSPMTQDSNNDGKTDGLNGSLVSGVTGSLSIDGGQKISITGSAGVADSSFYYTLIAHPGDRINMSADVKVVGDVSVTIKYNFRKGDWSYLPNSSISNIIFANGDFQNITVPQQTAPEYTERLVVYFVVRTLKAGSTGMVWLKNTLAENVVTDSTPSPSPVPSPSPSPSPEVSPVPFPSPVPSPEPSPSPEVSPVPFPSPEATPVPTPLPEPSPVSSPSPIPVDTQAPTSPSGLTVLQSATSVSLQWEASTDNTGVAGYNVYRNDSKIGDTSLLNYTDMDLVPGSNYIYYIKAFDTAGNVSAPSNQVDISYNMPQIIYSSPMTQDSNNDGRTDGFSGNFGTGITGTLSIDGGQRIDITGNTTNPDNNFFYSISVKPGDKIYASADIKVTGNLRALFWGTLRKSDWTTVKGGALSSFIYPSGDFQHVELPAFIVPPEATKLVLYFVIRGTESSGEGSVWLKNTLVETHAVEDVLAPTTPSGLTLVSKTVRSANMVWTASTDNAGVLGYNIYRNNALYAQSNTPNYDDLWASEGYTYDYYIRAYDVAGNLSPASNVITVNLVDKIAPTTPTGLVLQSQTDTSVILAWNASSDEFTSVSYEIYRDGTKIANTNYLGYEDKGLVSGTHTYYVRAQDGSGNISAPSNTLLVTLGDNLPPTSPSGLTLQSKTTSSASISWTASSDNVGVIGYYVYRNGTQIGSTASLSYTDTGLVTGNSYAYLVKAYDASNNVSASSNSITVLIDKALPILSFTMTQDSNKDGKTDGLNSSLTSGVTGTLSIDCAQKIDITGYNKTPTSAYVDSNFYYNMAVHAGDKINISSDIKVSGNVSVWMTCSFRKSDWSYVAGGALSNIILPGSDFQHVSLSGITVPVGAEKMVLYFYVRSETSGQPGTVWLKNALVDTAAPVQDTQAPTIPEGLKLVSTTTSVGISWTASTDNVGVAGYEIGLLDGTKMVTTSALSYTITGLTHGIEYNYSIKAFDAAGNKSPGASFIAKILSPSTLTTPSGLTLLTKTMTSVTISWENNDINAEGFEIYRDGTKVGTTSALNYTDTGLVLGNTYTYFVRAFDVAGYLSEASNTLVVAIEDTEPPANPGRLLSLTTTTTTASMSWEAAIDNVGVVGYEIFRDGTVVCTTTALSYTDTGLDNKKEYTYLIQALDAAGNRSGGLGFTALLYNPSAPTPPKALAATSRTTTTVSMSWAASTDTDGVSGYYIYRYGTRIGMTSASALYFTDSGLEPGKTYYYNVRAFDVNGNISNFSNSLIISQAPTSPYEIYLLSKTTTSISISWMASVDDVSVSGYEIYRDGAKVGTTSALSFIDTEVIDGSKYTYSIKAYDNDGNLSLASPELIVNLGDTEPPMFGLPRFNITTTTTSVSISWEAATDNIGVAGYEISRNDTLICTTSALSFSESGLDNRMDYRYSLQAFDAAGNRSSRFTLTIILPNPDAPTRPTGLKLSSRTATSVSMSWEASTDDGGVSGYYIYRNTTRIATTSALNFTDTGLVPGSFYLYWIRAFDTDGNISDMSGSIIVSRAPSEPSGLTLVSKTTTSASISWNASLDDISVAGYEIYRNGTRVGTTSALCFTDTGLILGNYYYSVKAYDNEGNFSIPGPGISVTIEDTEPPTAPANIKEVSKTTTSISISWSASTDNTGVAAYYVFRDNTCIATTSALSYTDSGLFPGTMYQYLVRAVDAAGNMSNYADYIYAVTDSYTVIFNSAMIKDSNNDGKTDALNGNLASAITGSLSIDEGQKISITGGTAKTSSNFYFNITVTPGAILIATADIKVSGDIGVRMLYNFRKSDWTIVPGGAGTATISEHSDFQHIVLPAMAIPAGATRMVLYFYLDPVNTGSTGTIWIRNALVKTFETTDAKTPTIPLNLALQTRTETSAAILWSASTDDTGVAGYEIYRGGTKIGNSASNYYIDKGLLPGTSYNYTVKAFDEKGDFSDASQILNVKTRGANGEMLYNPSFDANTDGWVLTAASGFTGGRDTNTYNSAPASYKIAYVNQSGGTLPTEFHNTVPLELVKGARYRLEFKARASANATIPEIRLVNWNRLSEYTQEFANPKINVPVTTEWTSYSFDFIADLTTNEANLDFNFENAFPYGMSLNIDSLSFKEVQATGLINLSDRTSGTYETLRKVIWGGDKFVAVGHGVILTSVDGNTWQEQEADMDLPILLDVVWAQNQYVAVSGEGSILSSPDGVTWTKVYEDTSYHLYAIAYGNGKYITAGANGKVMVSIDGVSWSGNTINPNQDYDSISFDGLKFVMVGTEYTGNGYSNLIISSQDGMNWSTCSTPSEVQYASGNELRTTTWSGSKFLASGYNYALDAGVVKNGIFLSDNGITWTYVFCNDSSRINAIGWDGSKYYYVTCNNELDSGKLFSSLDGITWEEVGLVNGVMCSIAFHDGKIVLVGWNGKIITN